MNPSDARVRKIDAPDRDVPVVSAPARGAPHRPRPSRMARLLLFICRSASLLVMLQMSACVIPVAPEFQDPPASQNYPPQFLSVSPEIGSIAATPSFTAVVTDPNVGDTLQYKWVFDYPPYDDAITRDLGPNTITPSADGQPTITSISLDFIGNGPTSSTPNVRTFTCTQIAQSIQQHRLELIVADGPLPTMGTNLNAVTLPAYSIEAAWTFNLSCAPGTTSP
jgi:hypothetical protein